MEHRDHSNFREAIRCMSNGACAAELAKQRCAQCGKTFPTFDDYKFHLDPNGGSCLLSLPR